MQPIQITCGVRRHSLWVSLVGTAVLVALLLPGCSSDEPTHRGSTADAYALVLRWFVERSETEADQPLVFVEALGEGVNIGLDTQAAVLSSTADFAEVRFIDDRGEAFSDGEVRDGGIFIALGPIVGAGTTVSIESAHITSESSTIVWAFSLVSRDAEWRMRNEPEQVDSQS